MTYVRNMGLSEATFAKQEGFQGFPVNTFSAHALSTHGTAPGRGDSGTVCSMETEKGLPESQWGDGEEWLILTGIFCRN